MVHTHFNLALIQWIADHRNIGLTRLFLFFTAVGDTNGYIAVATVIYLIWDKKLAIRASILVLATICFNHILKIWIKNPRPFVTQGTYQREWAIPPQDAPGLALDYSTPSGHAMAAASFYPYLYAAVNNRVFRVCAVALPLLIGLSRPYLGVHYVEDVVIGWAIGFLLAVSGVKYGDLIEKRWDNLFYIQQIGIAVCVSLFVCVLTILVNNWRFDSQPRTYMGYAGFLTGVIIAHPLERRYLRFNPRSSSVPAKILRCVLSITLVIITLWFLGHAFAKFADKISVSGYALEFLRYAIAGIVSIYVAPLIFIKVNLVEQMHEQ
jgi:membrane-associated phospholipid phosphatase